MSYKNAEILRDKNNDPIPIAFDTDEGIFKPITLKMVEKVDVQEVKDPALRSELEAMKNQILERMGEEFNARINNLPNIQKVVVENQQDPVEVTVTNQKEVQDVSGTVDIGNLPATDAEVKAELVAIKEQQSTTDSATLKRLADMESELTSTNEKLVEISEKLTEKPQVSDKIYGYYWNKESSPQLVRTDDSVGMEANVGIDGELVQNDFDNAPFFKKWHKVVDLYMNEFIRIPKVYLYKRSGEGFEMKRFSETNHPGFYLPWLFWDFENECELPYFDYGAHKASLDEGNKLGSKPGRHPLVSTNIVNMRNYARSNNVDGESGYQQHDRHAHDLLETLVQIEFGTLHSQSIMQGFASGRYSAADVVTVAEDDTNRAIVSNATANLYEVGQSIGIGSAHSNNNVSITPRQIIDIENYDEDNTAIVFDGDPIDIAIDDVIANRAYVTGFSSNIASSSGSINSHASGRYPCTYRGIESPWADVYEFMDGVNFSDRQAWVAKNAENYASNVFAEPYEKLSYINGDTNGYITEMGYDAKHPYAQFPVKVDGGTSTFYADYYYQTTGARIALVSGYWYAGARFGVSFLYAIHSSGLASVVLGGRLHKKASALGGSAGA